MSGRLAGIFTGIFWKSCHTCTSYSSASLTNSSPIDWLTAISTPPIDETDKITTSTPTNENRSRFWNSKWIDLAAYLNVLSAIALSHTFHPCSMQLLPPKTTRPVESSQATSSQKENNNLNIATATSLNQNILDRAKKALRSKSPAREAEILLSWHMHLCSQCPLASYVVVSWRSCF